MAERTVRWALEQALSSATTAEADAATVALARRYADDLDEAEVVSVLAGRWLREVQAWMDPVLYERVHALLDRVEQTAVLAQLGPKLLAALAELGMTPRARADVVRKGGSGGTGGPPTDNQLAQFRAERARRLGNT